MHLEPPGRYCPKCNRKPLLELRVVQGAQPDHRVEIDVCPACLGVWLDRTEEKKLFVLRDFVVGLTAAAHVQEDLRTGDCPSCVGHPQMRRVPVGAFAVDCCGQCGGMWFDGGELGPSLTRDGFLHLMNALRKAEG